MIESLSAVTLFTRDMAAAVDFYRNLGFQIKYGGAHASFTSFRAGPGFLNLMQVPPEETFGPWGRAIFYVTDVDAVHERALQAGLTPEFAPSDAPWGERYFHIRDPDGHEISFARPLDGSLDDARK